MYARSSASCTLPPDEAGHTAALGSATAEIVAAACVLASVDAQASAEARVTAPESTKDAAAAATSPCALTPLAEECTSTRSVVCVAVLSLRRASSEARAATQKRRRRHSLPDCTAAARAAYLGTKKGGRALQSQAALHNACEKRVAFLVKTVCSTNYVWLKMYKRKPRTVHSSPS